MLYPKTSYSKYLLAAKIEYNCYTISKLQYQQSAFKIGYFGGFSRVVDDIVDGNIGYNVADFEGGDGGFILGICG